MRTYPFAVAPLVIVRLNFKKESAPDNTVFGLQGMFNIHVSFGAYVEAPVGCRFEVYALAAEAFILFAYKTFLGRAMFSYIVCYEKKMG